MAVTKVYGLFLKSLATKQINLETDTFKMMLCSSGYTPNQDTHQYKNQVTSEVTGTGYTAGGAVLSAVTLTYDAASNTLVLDASDVDWLNATITADWAVIYDNTPSSDATRPVVAFIALSGLSSTSSTFHVGFDPTGVVALTAA